MVISTKSKTFYEIGYIMPNSKSIMTTYVKTKPEVEKKKKELKDKGAKIKEIEKYTKIGKNTYKEKYLKK